MNNMKRIILITVTLVVLSACSKYVQPSVLSEYEGTYEIESIIWRGSIDIDINHDGVKEADWISEFNGSPGYVKTWGKGEVFISSDNSLRITSTRRVAKLLNPGKRFRGDSSISIGKIRRKYLWHPLTHASQTGNGPIQNFTIIGTSRLRLR